MEEPSGGHRRLTINRPVYTYQAYHEKYPSPIPKPKTLQEKIADSCSCSRRKAWKILSTYLPVVKFARHYIFKEYLMGDMLAGLTVSFMHLPQAMGFGSLASLRPVHGLYSTLFPVLVYFIFGTSPYISFGTNAVMALLTQAAVEREADAYRASHTGSNVPENVTGSPFPSSPTDADLLAVKIGVAMMCSFLAGAFLTGFGLLRLGFLTSYLSVSFVGGFTTAAAVHIASSQVPKMFGIKVKSFSGAGKLVLFYIDFFSKIGETRPVEVIITVICIIILLLVKICINERFKEKMKMPVPIDLIVVVLGTIISHFAKFHDVFGVDIVGSIPSGLPTPALPRFESASNIIADSFVMAILSLAMSISMAKLLARKHSMETDDNQELVSYGLSNLISGFFSAFPSSTAPPRSMVLSNLGAKTTMHAVPTILFFLLILYFIGPLFEALPLSVLAAMILVSMKELLMQYGSLAQIWRTNIYDFVIWVITNSVAVLVNLDYGIMAGIAVSVLSVVIQSQLTKGHLVELVASENLFVSTNKAIASKASKTTRVFRMSSSLFFATAEGFKTQLYDQVLHPQKYRKQKNRSKLLIQSDFNTLGKETEKVDGTEDTIGDGKGEIMASANQLVLDEREPMELENVIIDCTMMAYIDMGGCIVLQQIVKEYKALGIQIYLTGLNTRAMHVLENAKFFDKYSKDNVFIDALDAVESLDGSIQRV